MIQHELSHSNEAWSIKDFKLDFVSNNNLNHWELLKFMLKHPKSFYQLLPVTYSKGKFRSYDINLLVMFLSMILVFTLTIYFGLKYL